MLIYIEQNMSTRLDIIYTVMYWDLLSVPYPLSRVPRIFNQRATYGRTNNSQFNS